MFEDYQDPPEPQYMQAVAGAPPAPTGSYYTDLPDPLSYPNQAGSAYLPGFGDDMTLTPPELPPGEAPPPPAPMTEYGPPDQTAISPYKSYLGYAWTAASVASAGASAYHGYKRNKSVGWAIGWAVLGSLFPVIVPAIALAQGFGKRKAGR